MEKDEIKISVFTKNEQIRDNVLSSWFKNLKYFNPKDMMSYGFTNGKTRKYNEKKLFTYIWEDYSSIDRCSISISDDRNEISLIKNSLRKGYTQLYTILELSLFEKNRDNIYKLINELMVEHNAICANLLSFNDLSWQNMDDLSWYDFRGKSKEEIVYNIDEFGYGIVDIEYNPGHTHINSGIWFGSCWDMWFGKDYYEHISYDSLKNFKGAYQNLELDNDVIRITLYESPWDYEKKENRDIQWKFRREMKVDEVAHDFEKRARELDDQESDPEIEIFTGNFENGGTHLIKTYYLDDKPTVKSKANKVVIFEKGYKGKLIKESIELLK